MDCKCAFCDTTDTTNTRTTINNDLSVYYKTYTDLIADTTRDVFVLDEYQCTLLLYKNWLTIESWQRELYIKNVYSKLKMFKGYPKYVLNRKTCKSTTPILRNKIKTRS